MGRLFGKRKRFDTRLVQLQLWDCWYVVDLIPVSFYKFVRRICKVQRGCEETVIIAGISGYVFCCAINSVLRELGTQENRLDFYVTKV